MLFGMVSGVGRGMGVLDGGLRAPRAGAVSRGFSPICFSGMDAYLFNRNVFVSCMKS